MSDNSKPGMALSLRQLLIRASRPENDAPFTCEECVAALEYYADGIVTEAEADKLQHLIRRHLDYCPECHEKVERVIPQTLEQEIADLEARLADLEARLPAHSIPPSMVIQLDELEEQLSDKQARLTLLQQLTDG